MSYDKYSRLKGTHAFLSASQYSWLNYDEEQLIRAYRNFKAKELGTRLHAQAAGDIELGLKRPRSKKTFDMYVNDAIGFHLKPEQVLYFSDYFYGTADAINYRDGVLRIHDLKTGLTPAKMNQLYIYAALFCLQNGISPNDMKDIELRIYQNDEVREDHPDPNLINDVMEKGVQFSKRIQQIEEEEN